MEEKIILIVGAGLTGATIANQYAEDGKKVFVIDKRYFWFPPLLKGGGFFE